MLNLVVFVLVANSGFLLDFPARQNTSYVETVSLPSLTEFTLCFWMKRGFDDSLRGTIMSYVTTQELKSLFVLLDSGGALNIYIMDSRYVTKCHTYFSGSKEFKRKSFLILEHYS